MAVFAHLSRPHRQIQRQQHADAALFYRRLTHFDDDVFAPDDEGVPGGGEVVLTNVTPWTGWVRPEAERWSRDPLALRRTFHDVVPREVLDDEDPTNTYRDGSARDVALIARGIIEALTACDLMTRAAAGPINEQFNVEDAHVHVVNVVHTSYCALKRAPPTLPSVDASSEGAPVILSHLWMWRRFLHLGPQQNHVNTSLKLCFVAPFKATHLIFETLRVLETGAANLNVARIMFEHGTLRYFQAAGATQLHITKRKSHNIVATTEMPGKMGLHLKMLTWRFDHTAKRNLVSGSVVKVPRKFPGIIVPHPDPKYKKLKFLIFQNGAVVCVGGATVAIMQEALGAIYPTLVQNLDTPANRAWFDAQVASGSILPAVLAPSRKRKRDTGRAAGSTPPRKRKRGTDL